MRFDYGFTAPSGIGNILRGRATHRRSELEITKRTSDALTIDDKETVFWDRDLRGFRVRIHATGHKVYVVQSRDPLGRSG